MAPIPSALVADDNEPEPTSFSRRRLLVAGGFAAATVYATGRITPTQTGPRVIAVTGGAVPPTTVPVTVPGGAPMPPPGHVFSTVINGGRVIDPESGYDEVVNVGIDGGTITAISPAGLVGTTTIDAAGLVVSPGFIDLLSYEPNDYGVWFKVADGVTTNIGMHGINMVAEDFFTYFGDPERRPPVHYGGAFDNPYMREINAMGSSEATMAQIQKLEQQLEDGFGNGWLGLDVEPEYTPWVTTEEITALARVAKRFELPVFFHARYSSPDEPGKNNAAALAEVLQVASETGASVHIDHITSTGGTFTMDESIATLDAARAAGLDVTACAYPYDFWATYLASARFAPGWQERFRIGYQDLAIPGTGERLTESSFRTYQQQNKLVAAYAIPEADVRTALSTSWIMLGSDGILEPGNNNHPRAAGTFARTLGKYVRDEQLLDLRDALAKMTYLPALRLQSRCPSMRRKGRLQLGADADITLFDPTTVIDRATVDNPAQESVGIEWVLVSGTPVKTPAGIDRSQRLGNPIRPDLA